MLHDLLAVGAAGAVFRDADRLSLDAPGTSVAAAAVGSRLGPQRPPSGAQRPPSGAATPAVRRRDLSRAPTWTLTGATESSADSTGHADANAGSRADHAVSVSCSTARRIVAQLLVAAIVACYCVGGSRCSFRHRGCRSERATPPVQTRRLRRRRPTTRRSRLRSRSRSTPFNRVTTRGDALADSVLCRSRTTPRRAVSPPRLVRRGHHRPRLARRANALPRGALRRRGEAAGSVLSV